MDYSFLPVYLVLAARATHLIMFHIFLLVYIFILHRIIDRIRKILSLSCYSLRELVNRLVVLENMGAAATFSSPVAHTIGPEDLDLSPDEPSGPLRRSRDACSQLTSLIPILAFEWYYLVHSSCFFQLSCVYTYIQATPNHLILSF